MTKKERIAQLEAKVASLEAQVRDLQALIVHPVFKPYGPNDPALWQPKITCSTKDTA